MSTALSQELQALINQPGPAALGPESRLGTLTQGDLNRTLNELFLRRGVPAKAELIRALLLLWHDHHDASHVISQGIENPDGSFVNGSTRFAKSAKHGCWPTRRNQYFEFQ